VLDTFDNRLMQLLRREGRLSNESLAKQLGVTTPTIQRRFNRLVKGGYILFTALVDPKKVGVSLTTHFAMKLNYQNINHNINQLIKHPNIGVVTRITGRYDVISTGWFRSIDELSAFVEEDLTTYSGLRSCDTSICIHTTKGAHTLLNPSLIESDEKDLIYLLQKNGRERNTSLAKKLNVSPSTIGRRIHDLVDSDTIQFAALPNPSKLPERITVLVGIKINPNRLHGILDEMASFNQVRFVSSTIGPFDIIATVIAPSQEQIPILVENQIGKLPGVTDIETFICSNIYYSEQHPAAFMLV
jgi:Lrp/AsnC family transcriptional regulator for asnA, asnC and gidA